MTEDALVCLISSMLTCLYVYVCGVCVCVCGVCVWCVCGVCVCVHVRTTIHFNNLKHMTYYTVHVHMNVQVPAVTQFVNQAAVIHSPFYQPSLEEARALTPA